MAGSSNGAAGGGGLPSPDVGSLMAQLAEQQSQGGAAGSNGSSGAGGGMGDLSALSGMTGGMGGAGSGAGGLGGMPTSGGSSTPTDRVTELVHQGMDVAAGQLFGLLPEPIQRLLKIGAQDTDAEKARKQQMMARINQMDQAQFQAFKQRVSQEERLKQQEAEVKRQRAAQKDRATPELSMPQGKTGRGSALTGGKNSKKSATSLLQNKRKAEPNSPD